MSKPVRSARVHQRAEFETQRTRGEHVADELIRDVLFPGPSELPVFEHGLEIPAAFDEIGPLRLKITLREFRFKEHIAELHIDFGSLDRPAHERHARQESEFGTTSAINPKDAAHFRFPGDSRITEDIHQQGVGTHRRVGFTPWSISGGKTPSALSMHFSESLAPLGSFQNRCITRLEKISVIAAAFRRLVNDDRQFPMTDVMWQPIQFRENVVSSNQLLAQRKGGSPRFIRHECLPFQAGVDHLSQSNAVGDLGVYGRRRLDFFAVQPHSSNQGGRDQQDGIRVLRLLISVIRAHAASVRGAGVARSW